tara:strand:+ start:3796 stop:4311 length:516 start_codon:yes stop_codon:yes gene_type:complete
MKLKKYLYKSVKSTNDIAIKKIKQGVTSGIIIAKKQTRGRGRHGSKWIYIKNNLFISVFFNLSSNISLMKLTSNSSKIVQKSLSKFLKKKITIKKPNDLLINKKKLCGILQEIMFYKTNKFAIIGIGININGSPIIDNYPTTYINFFKKKKLTSFKIYNEIKKNFEKYLNK